MFDDILGRLLLATLLLAAASLWFVARRRKDGLFGARPGAATAGGSEPHLSRADLGAALGDRATFVQFSTSTCATCPQVSRTLGDVARRTDGVVHVEVPAEERMDLVRRFGVLRTPTVLLLGPRGEVRARAAGPIDVRRALAALREHAGVVATHV